VLTPQTRQLFEVANAVARSNEIKSIPAWRLAR
jgi:hypothetical protein